MTKLPEFTRATGIEDGLMLLHDAAMSKDEVRACEGRLAKDLVNMLFAWLDREEERSTHPATLLLATRSAAISAFFTVLVNTAPPCARVAIAEHLRDHWIEQYDASVSELRARPTQPSGG